MNRWKVHKDTGRWHVAPAAAPGCPVAVCPTHELAVSVADGLTRGVPLAPDMSAAYEPGLPDGVIFSCEWVKTAAAPGAIAAGVDHREWQRMWFLLRKVVSAAYRAGVDEGKGAA